MYILRKVIKCPFENVINIDESHKPPTMEEWLGTIAYSKALITNSYHGMIMAILNHVPFVAILGANRASGMNDRFLTLLKKLNLESRIVNEGEEYVDLLSKNIDWQSVDKEIESFRAAGSTFLSF